MTMEKECSIIKDLYALYSEDAVSTDTKRYIEDHIGECESCKEYYQRMDWTLEGFDEPEESKTEPEELEESKAGLTELEESKARQSKQKKLKSGRLKSERSKSKQSKSERSKSKQSKSERSKIEHIKQEGLINRSKENQTTSVRKKTLLSKSGLSDEQLKSEEKRIRNSFKKIKKRWIASLMIAVLMVPVLGFMIRLTKNQISGYGLRYTNIDDVVLCEKYFKYLQNGEYKKATELLADWKLKEYKEEKYELENGKKEYYGKKVNIYNEEWIKTKPEIPDITDADTYYQEAIFSCQEGVLIPENVWNEYVKEEYVIEDIYGSDNIKYYVADKNVWEEYQEEGVEPDFEDDIFVKISTDWGNYYVCRKQETSSKDVNGKKEQIVLYLDECTDTKWAISGKNMIEPELLYLIFDYVPSDVYKEAADYFIDEWMKYEELFYKNYGLYENMSDDEIKENLIEHFAARFENYFNEGYEIIDISYFDDDQYEVVHIDEKYDSMERISVKIKDKNGAVEKGVFTVFTKGNQLHIADCDDGRSHTTGIYRFFESMAYFDFYSKR